jgi:hypothetical protein
MATKNQANISVDHEGAVRIIMAIGNKRTPVIISEPGVGKSSMLNEIALKTGFTPVYIDAPVFDVPDIMMPMVDTEAKLTHFAINAQLHTSRPCVYMVDELLKASGPTKLMLTRFILERTFGNDPIHKQSLVSATSNATADGVGDSIAGHLQNRILEVNLKKPSAQQWLKWAYPNDIAPEVCAWVKQFEHCMQSYTEFSSGKVDNPYIYDPKSKRGAFVSPRSLHAASDVIKQRHIIGHNETHATLVGTIGYSAAGDMMAYVNVADKLPSIDMVLADPKRCTLPAKDPGALLVMMFSLSARSTQSTIDLIAKYVDRCPKEFQLLFFQALSQNSSKPWATSTPVVTKWFMDNKTLLVSDIDD